MGWPWIMCVEVLTLHRSVGFLIQSFLFSALNGFVTLSFIPTNVALK